MSVISKSRKTGQYAQCAALTENTSGLLILMQDHSCRISGIQLFILCQKKAHPKPTIMYIRILMIRCLVLLVMGKIVLFL
jgi:hypothetical protein